MLCLIMTGVPLCLSLMQDYVNFLAFPCGIMQHTTPTYLKLQLSMYSCFRHIYERHLYEGTWTILLCMHVGIYVVIAPSGTSLCCHGLICLKYWAGPNCG